LISSPLTSKNVTNGGVEINSVNGLLKKNRDSTKGTGSKMSVGDDNNQDNIEGGENNNDDDELLSSIHSIQ
jgi:hypothetical protein